MILPRAPDRPVGAIKIVYEHADRLTARGHSITVIHLGSTRAGNLSSWFRFSQPVGSLTVPELTSRWIPGTFDVTIATTWLVATEVAALPARTGRKVLFLQDHESYLLGSAEERAAIRQAVRMPWPIIVNSKPVERLVAMIAHSRCHRIPCTIDTGAFGLDSPVDSPERTLIGFPARTEQAKRTHDAVSALEIVRSRVPDQPVEAWCFGSCPPRLLAPWVRRYHSLDDQELRRLYNHSAVFIVPSEHEGFGLPGAEAMACGAALVSTRNAGVSAYAAHRKSAWLCPVRSPAALADATIQLLADTALRHRIARAGVRRIGRQNPDGATDALEAALQEVAGPSCRPARGRGAQ